jgi:hypothetical protein
MEYATCGPSVADVARRECSTSQRRKEHAPIHRVRRFTYWMTSSARSSSDGMLTDEFDE